MALPKVFSMYAEMTPNPMAMKFVADRLLLPEGVQLEFLNSNKAVTSPLALKLFEFPFVRGVYIAANFITVLKNDKAKWDEVVFDVRDYIKEFILNGGHVWEKEATQQNEITATENTSPIEYIADHTGAANEAEQKIIDALDEYVKPAVEGDGGIILFKSFNDGVVTLQLKGSCSGCPSSSLTLKTAVEQLLKRMVPEVKEVREESST